MMVRSPAISAAEVTECPHGGYDERLDPTVEPWATLAPLCWDSPSSFRMGWEAEAHGIAGNPYKSPFARGVFDAGRQRCKEAGLAGFAQNTLLT